MELTSLTELAEQELAVARQAHSGRAARTLHGGREHRLRQTLVALAAGHELSEHESPGEATLQVITGRVRLTSGTAAVDASAGDLLAIPPERHGLLALEDAVVLLTVVAEV